MPEKIELARAHETLARILSSPGFRNSKQCQAFLRYVVEHSLADADERLKERNIGVDVFGRAPDYDTGEDPIVRVRATEIRKRLAQYYNDSASAGDVRFEIPSGSYRVEFHAPAAIPEARSASRRSRAPLYGAAVLAALGLIGAGFFWTRPAPAEIDIFWAPMTGSQKPVLIYCGQPVVYFLSRDVHAKYRQKLSAEDKRGAYAVVLEPGTALRGSDVIPVTDQFVGIGNAHTAALLSAFFALKRKPVEIRYANDLTFSDLRGSPSVLIGAFSNLWTLEMTGKLRFIFEQEEGVRRIRDRAGNRTWQLAKLAPDGKTPEDYAVVCRLFDTATGQPLVSAAGITQYGTRAAGEFLADPGRLKQALSKAGAGWPARNLQILLHTEIYKGTPGPPRVVGLHIW